MYADDAQNGDDKLIGFDQYIEQRDMQDVGPEPMGPGEMQNDPDKPSRAEDLISALKEIIHVAKKAIDAREKGLGDRNGQNKPTEEEGDGDGLGRTVSVPSSDSAEGMFGAD